MTIKRITLSILLVLFLSSLWLILQLNNRTNLESYSAYFPNEATNLNQKPKLWAKYLGTSTIVISDGETSIMTDGFFTRPSFLEMLTGNMQPNPEIVGTALKSADITNLAAVIPIHSHHDHALDAPEVAKQTGAVVIGSESTANIARGWGLPERQIIVPSTDQILTFGQFEVELIPSKHLPVSSFQNSLTGIGETIDRPMKFPAPLKAFKEGGSFSILIKHPLGNVLVHGSAGFIHNALKTREADTIFIGIAGVGKQDEASKQSYINETINAVGAKTIVPIHWDDFNTPASQPLRTFPKIMSDFDSDISTFIDDAKSDSTKTIKLLNNRDILIIRQ